MKKVCVFCGSKAGGDPRYTEAATQLGKLLVQGRLELVYGGGSVGLMGVVADAVLEAGGAVVGILPRRLATKELLHPGVADMRVVGSMHERKAMMTQLSDAFVALPGGFGTLEELFEVVTWAQLGIHSKPIGLLNTAGYYDSLVAFVDHAIKQSFIKPKYRDLFVVADDAETLLDKLKSHRVPESSVIMKIDES